MSPLLILVIDSMTIKICYLVRHYILQFCIFQLVNTVYKLKTDIYRHNYKQHLQRMSLLIWFINFANVICEPYFFYLKKKIIIINKNKRKKRSEMSKHVNQIVHFIIKIWVTAGRDQLFVDLIDELPFLFFF